MNTDYWDGVIIGALGSGFLWRLVFFFVDDIRKWWREEGKKQWKRGVQ